MESEKLREMIATSTKETNSRPPVSTVYRQTKIGSSLCGAIAELKEKYPDKISDSLAEKIKICFDVVLPTHLENQAEKKIIFQAGKLKSYICLDHEWHLDLRDVEIRETYQLARVGRLKVKAIPSRNAKLTNLS